MEANNPDLQVKAASRCKKIGFRAVTVEGKTSRWQTQAKARKAAGEGGHVRVIRVNHNGTRFETPMD